MRDDAGGAYVVSTMTGRARSWVMSVRVGVNGDGGLWCGAGRVMVSRCGCRVDSTMFMMYAWWCISCDRATVMRQLRWSTTVVRVYGSMYANVDGGRAAVRVAGYAGVSCYDDGDSCNVQRWVCAGAGLVKYGNG